ncbi:MAG: endonuclease [Paracoccaceae bacterium]|jgi:endonuclease/exonuclease/phosphatase family metal-dependent hydrolase|nr:endonuclease [Paracoccaceae bacterium]
MTNSLRIAAYNVEWFAGLFDEDDQLVLDDSWSARHGVVKRRQAEAVAEVVRAVDADVMLIVEAPNDGRHQSCVTALERFADRFDLRQSKVMIGFSNGTTQELALIYDPARVAVRHDPRGAKWAPPRSGRRLRLEKLGPLARAPRFDGVLPLDIDEDGLVDLHQFSKPPVEAEVSIGDHILRLIGVHAKSKAPHGAKDDEDAVRLQIANRRKQLAQCEWIRRRVDQHLDEDQHVIVLGDFNDGPGIDRYERLFGRSGVEVAMGDISNPNRLLRNPYVKARLHPDFGWRPATARFYNRRTKGYLNALIDFIMLSPRLAAEAKASWRIWHPFDDDRCFKDEEMKQALLDGSDHYPVSVDLTFG